MQLAVPRIYEQLKADAQRLQQLQRGGQTSSSKGRAKNSKKSAEARPPVSQLQWEIVEIVSAEVVDAATAWCVCVLAACMLGVFCT